jgi:hypothetical protein
MLNSRGGYYVRRAFGEVDRGFVMPLRRTSHLHPVGERNTVRVAFGGAALNVWLNGRHGAHVALANDRRETRIDLLHSTGLHVVLHRIEVRAPLPADLLPPNGPQVLYEDLFFDNRSLWPLGDRAGDPVDARITEAGYDLTTRRSQAWIVPAGYARTAGDLVAEVDLSAPEAPRSGEVGISVRASFGREAGTVGYTLFVSRLGGYRVVREEGATQHELVRLTGSAAVNPGAGRNVVRFAAHGEALAVWVYGRQLATVHGGALSGPGYVALRATRETRAVVRRVSAWQSQPVDVAPVTQLPPLVRRSAGDDTALWTSNGIAARAGRALALHALAEGATLAYPVVARGVSGVALTAEVALDQGGVETLYGIGLGGGARGVPSYQLLLDASGAFTLARAFDGRPPTLPADALAPWQSHAGIWPGESSNELKLVSRDRTLEAYANGWLLAQVELPEPVPAGLAHVVAYLGVSLHVRLHVRRYLLTRVEDDNAFA